MRKLFFLLLLLSSFYPAYPKDTRWELTRMVIKNGLYNNTIYDLYEMVQRQISYRLLPVNEDWKMTSVAEGLWYCKLPAGKYTLQAKLVFPDGKEGDVIQLEILVKDKWFHSAWMYVAYVLIAVGLIYGFILLILRKKTVRQPANGNGTVEGYRRTVFSDSLKKTTANLLPGERPSATEPERNRQPEAGYVAEELPASIEEWLVEEDEEPPVRTNTKKTILIVEDHKDIRLYLKIMFGNDYNLLMATNGQEGLDAAMAELPDLILCDVVMPLKDGLQCCREIRECPKTCGIPFIMLTAKVEDEDIIHGLELGADDYMLKPFTPRALKAKVYNLINSRQTLKQTYAKMFMLPGTDMTGASDPEYAGEEIKVEDSFISSVIKIIEENIL